MSGIAEGLAGLKRRRIAILLVAVVVAAGLVVVLALRSEPTAHRPVVDDAGGYTSGTVPTAPDGSLQAVADLLPKALSYDYAHLDDDLATATAVMTDDFAAEYTDTFDATVRELAASKKAVSKSHVRAAGLVEAADSGKSATVLAFVDQVLVGSKGKAPVRVSQVRVLVTVQRVDGSWRLSAIDPL